jgi:hypothetical protein
MDDQSEATLKKLLPELGEILSPVAPDDALVLRLEDRWDTFAEGRSARTMTADFCPSDEGGELGHLRGYFGDALGEAFRHLQFDDTLSRDVYKRDDTVVRIWRATTTHPLGYEFDSVRVDVKVAVTACPLVFSEAFERYRARATGGAPSGGLREHAMSLDDFALIAVVTERLVVVGAAIDDAALTADGFSVLSNGDLMKRQVGSDLELRVRYARAAGAVTIETTMMRGGASSR